MKIHHSISYLHAAAFAASALLGLAAPRVVAADSKPLLIPGPVIELAGSSGKFDFLEIDPGRHRLLAAHENDGSADFFDLTTNRLITRLKIGGAVGVTIDPKTGNYYASVQEDQRVAVIDPVTFKEIASVKTPGPTDAIIFLARHRRVYVTHDNGDHVWAIDPDTFQVSATVEIPGEPECMAYDEARDRLYLNIKDRNEVVVIDPAANKVVAVWPLAPVTGPHGVAFDPTTSRLYAAGDNGLLAVLDVVSGRVIGTAPIALKVDQIAFDPFTQRVYCAGADWMSVVQTTAGGAQTLDKVKTAATARNVAVDPASHWVWTTYTDGKQSYAQSWHLP